MKERNNIDEKPDFVEARSVTLRNLTREKKDCTTLQAIISPFRIFKPRHLSNLSQHIAEPSNNSHKVYFKQNYAKNTTIQEIDERKDEEISVKNTILSPFSKTTSNIQSLIKKDETNIQIFRKIVKVSSDSKNQHQIKKNEFYDDKIVLSEEEFGELNNLERGIMTYVIQNYFELGVDVKMINRKKEEFKRRHEKYHYDHRIRIHQINQGKIYKHSELFDSDHKEKERYGSLDSASISNDWKNKNLDWFSKYNLNFIHIDLMINEKRKIQKRCEKIYDEEKCIKIIMTIFKENNKNNFFEDIHHYNKLINGVFKERFYKNCCKKKENKGLDCHNIKYYLMTFHRLIDELLKDQSYSIMVIYAYDYFFTSEFLLTEFFRRFFIPKPLNMSQKEIKLFSAFKMIPKQKKILEIIKLWVENRLNDFIIDSNLLMLLKAFLFLIDLLYKDEFSLKIAEIKSIINNFSTIEYSKHKKKFSTHNVVKIEKNLKSIEENLFNVFDINTIANQITIYDYELYSKLSIKDLFDYVKHYPKNNDIIKQIIKRFNLLHYFLVLIIVIQSKNSEKTKIIGLLIELADKCLNIQNYNGLFIISSALSKPLIISFKEAWNNLPLIQKTLDNKLKNIVSINSRYENLRKIIKNSVGAYIPPINIVLGDLTKLMEKDDYVIVQNKEFVNVKKMEDIYCVLTQCLKGKNNGYNFEKKEQCFNFFKNGFQNSLAKYIDINKIQEAEIKLFELSKKYK